jgi:hypothetical protein
MDLMKSKNYILLTQLIHLERDRSVTRVVVAVVVAGSSCITEQEALRVGGDTRQVAGCRLERNV